MKLSIGKKLTISFLGLALLVLLSGLVGIFVLDTVSISADTVVKEKVPIQYAVIKASTVVEKIKEAVIDYIAATTDLNKKRRDLLYLVDEFDMWISMIKLGSNSENFKISSHKKTYDKKDLKIIVPQGSSKILTKVVKILDESVVFRKNCEELMSARNDFLSYSVTQAGKSYDLPSFLRIIFEEHAFWVKSLRDAANAAEIFKGNTDPKRGFMGVWLQTYKVNDKELMKLLSKMDRYNQKLMKYAVKINSHETLDLKLKYFNRSKGPTARIEEIFGKLHEHIKPIYAKLEWAKQERFSAVTVSANKISKHLDLLVVDAEKEMTEALAVSEKIKKTGSTLLIILTVAAMLIANILGIMISRRLTINITAIADITKEIAAGNLHKTVNIKSSDELGQLASDTNTMTKNLREMISQITNFSSQLTQSSNDLSGLSSIMAEGASSMSQKSESVSAAAEQMNSSMNVVAATCEQAATNVNSVSIATDQINSSICEIGNNSGQGRSITQEAVTRAESATNKVNELNMSASEISKFTEVISEISDQTNLLALNATIEAARAGEVGKGFAVVASEIKELAIQTGNATNDIKNRIAGIQLSTSDTIKEIKGVALIIENVNEIVGTIATSVEEQSSTTNEISHNMGQAADGLQEVNVNVSQSSSVANEIAKDISEVNANSKELHDSSRQVNINATNLKDLSDRLKELVDKFKL